MDFESLVVTFDGTSLFGYTQDENGEEFTHLLSTTLSDFGALNFVPSVEIKEKHKYFSEHINNDKFIKLDTRIESLSSIMQPTRNADPKRIEFFSGLFSAIKAKSAGVMVSDGGTVIIALPSQLALLNCSVRYSDIPEYFPSWDDRLFLDIEKAAGIAGFSKVLVTSSAIPLVEYFNKFGSLPLGDYKDKADREDKDLKKNQYVFVVEVTDSGFILSPVGHEDLNRKEEQCPKQLAKQCKYIPFDVCDWFKRQINSKPEEIDDHPYYLIEDKLHQEHYINTLLTSQDTDSDGVIPMSKIAPLLLASLKNELRKKLNINIAVKPDVKVDPISQRLRNLEDYESLFSNYEEYKEFFKVFCYDGDLHKFFVPYVIVVGSMTGNRLLKPIFEDAFTSLFRIPDSTAASRCVCIGYHTVLKAVWEFANRSTKLEYSSGYEVFDKVVVHFPQSTKEQKAAVPVKSLERPMLFRRLVPDWSKEGDDASVLTLKLSYLGRDKEIESKFDFRLQEWHLGSRVEAELIVELGDRMVLRTYLNGQPFEVALPDNTDVEIVRLSPGVYEFFSCVEHKLHWTKMNSSEARVSLNTWSEL